MRMESILLALLLITSATGKPQATNPTKPQESREQQVCLTKECVTASANLLQLMDLEADPCSDFHKFACGKFEAEAVIRDEDSVYGPFVMARERVYEVGRKLMEQEDQAEGFKTDSKLRVAYQSCMDEQLLEDLGVKPAQELLTEMGGWPVLMGDKWSKENFTWYKYHAEMEKHGFASNGVVQIENDHGDSKNASWRVFVVDQPHADVPREYLIKGFNDSDVQAIYKVLVASALLLGADQERAGREMKEVLLFKIKLAEISAPKEERRNEEKLYNPTTAGGMKSLPGFPASWAEYLQSLADAVGVHTVKINSDEKIIVKNPSYLEQLSDVLVMTDDRVVANYMGVKVLLEVLPFLNKQATSIHDKLKEALYGYKSKPKWKKCLEYVGFNSYIGPVAPAAGSLYVRSSLEGQEKEKVKEMVKRLKATFQSMIEEAPWMDENTKEEAKRKNDAMKAFVGYPDELLDQDIIDSFYDSLQVQDTSFLGNRLAMGKFWQANNYKQLRERIDPNDWKPHSKSANADAYYDQYINAMEIPAGIMQGYFFDSLRPQYLNYGSLGAVIGHELTHGFDDQGRQRNFEGAVSDWWEPSTAEQYAEKAKCIIEYYNNFTDDQVGLQLNGINTQGENIADHGGLKEAYRAYEGLVEEIGEEQLLPGLQMFTQRQLFFAGYASIWCLKYKDAYLKLRISTDWHAPTKFRILGTLANNVDFARNFGCPPGSPMNPEKKCQVW